MTKNGISIGKIDFLENSDKTSCSTVNSINLEFIPKNTKMLIRKTAVTI